MEHVEIVKNLSIKKCHVVSWPASVGSGLLYIVMTGCPDKACLKKVMEPILRKLGPSSFDCVDSKLAWSSKRPVWFQSIVDLLEPFFIPILGIFVNSQPPPTLFIKNICFTEKY